MPTKAAWLALADNVDGIEFEHFLATRLSMTVAQIRARMTQAEFVRWEMYYARDAQAKEMAARQTG